MIPRNRTRLVVSAQYTYPTGETLRQKEKPMGNIVMTLLVPRKPQEETDYPYAAQIVFPKELNPGEATPITSVRLIDKSGKRETMLRSVEFYHPKEWRAATLSEQTQYAANFKGNPQPWYCVLNSTSESVYDYPGSGDKDTNNGQQWSIENLESDWKVETKMRQRCEEEMGAEFSRRIAKWGENEW